MLTEKQKSQARPMSVHIDVKTSAGVMGPGFPQPKSPGSPTPKTPSGPNVPVRSSSIFPGFGFLRYKAQQANANNSVPGPRIGHA